MSAAPVSDVPPGATTVTSTVADTCTGAVTVRDVSEATTREVPGVAPKLTAVAPVKPLPVTVIVGPPASGPRLGETAETTGRPTAAATPGVVASKAAPATTASDTAAATRRIAVSRNCRPVNMTQPF